LNGEPDLMAPPLLRRMACWLYEGILLFAVLLIATLVFSIAGQMRSGIDSLRPVLMAFLFVVAGLYCSWFWSKGQTLPMRTWRIRMVDRFGRPVQQGRAALRYVYCLMWFIPTIAALQSRRFTLGEAAVIFLGWVAFWALLSRLHPQRQFWHDALAGTRLVEAPAPR
jgi:uncharacterized RDD family membrane protein YckC